MLIVKSQFLRLQIQFDADKKIERTTSNLIQVAIDKINTAQLYPDTFFLFSQIKYEEIPINRYRIVQTGPKTPFGGLKEGLFSVVYHVLTDSKVKKPPNAPIDKGIIKHIINGRNDNFLTAIGEVLNLINKIEEKLFGYEQGT